MATNCEFMQKFLYNLCSPNNPESWAQFSQCLFFKTPLWWTLSWQALTIKPQRYMGKISDSAWYAWSSKHILNMLAGVCGLVKQFLNWKSWTYWNQAGGDWRSEFSWKQNFYSNTRVSCRTIHLPSFKGLQYKLAKIALFIYLIQYWVECMMSSVNSLAYLTHFQI